MTSNTTTTLAFRGNATVAFAPDATGITVHFRTIKRQGDEFVTDRLLEPLRLEFASLSGAVRDRAFVMGMTDRLRDKGALSRTTTGGKVTSASTEEKRAEIAALIAHFASGTEAWDMASPVSSLSADVRNLINALIAAFGLDAAAAEEAVRAMSGRERAALRVDPEVKPHLDAIEAAAGSGADTAGLKAKLAALRKPQ